MQQKQRPNLVDLTMEKQELMCTICLNYLKEDDPYEKWPCPSNTPHIFHYDCMLNTLRRKNTCPMCRHPTEASRVPNDSISEFFSNLVF